MAASIALIAVATAAEPAEGTISKATPKVEWTGDLISSGVTAEAWNNGQTDTPCESPTCDPFTLTVNDGGAGVNLVIKTRVQTAAAQGNNGTATLRVTDPAGTVTVYTGESGPETDLKTTIKNAASGAYQIDTTASFICCTPTSHVSTAELTGAGFAPVAPTTTVAPPAVTPGPSAAPETTLSIKAPSVSAKKAKKAKKFTASLTASAPLTGVNLVLVDRKKKIGSAKVARVEGTQSVVIKLTKKAKLKKGGRYQLSAGGKDAQGRTVVATVAVKVKK
jgi:hypothetical protein